MICSGIAIANLVLLMNKFIKSLIFNCPEIKKEGNEDERIDKCFLHRRASVCR